MATKIWAVALVVVCTLFTSTAQVFYKFGALKLPSIFTNWQLLAGLILYAFGAVILLISLKGGDLTILYPIIATSYIWVGLMSNYFFHEELNVLKWSGMALIIFGISLIGFGSKKGSVLQYKEAI